MCVCECKRERECVCTGMCVSSCNFAKSFAAIDSNYASRTMKGKAQKVQKNHMLRQDVAETPAHTETHTHNNIYYKWDSVQQVRQLDLKPVARRDFDIFN